MYPIHDYHLYFSSAGAQADVHTLYNTINSHFRDVSLAKLLIEKGEFKYSTDSNELFVLTRFVFKCLPSCGGVYMCVWGGACVGARARVCVVHMCEFQNCKPFSVTSLGSLVYGGSAYVFLMVMIHVMEQLPEVLIGAGFLIIKSVCSDYDYLTVTMVFICIHFFGFFC